MKKILEKLYYILLFSFVLPSGSILGLPVKIVLCLAILLVLLILNEKVFFDKITICFLIIFASLFIWSIISLYNGFLSTALSFLKSFFSLIFIIWITKYLYEKKIINQNKSLKIIAKISLFLIISKLLLSLGLSLGIIQINSLINIYNDVFNTQLTTMYFPIGSFMFYRLMVSNDSLPYIWFSFYIISNKKKTKKFFVCFLMAIYTFIIYSRAMILEYALIMGVYFCLYLKKVYKKRGILGVGEGAFALLVIFAVGFAFASAFTELHIIDSIKYRFSGMSSSASDNIRDEQFKYLTQGFKSNFFFGSGAGAYLRDYTRSNINLYSYELEYVSFLYQFGIFGFLLIIGTTIYAFYKICFDDVRNNTVKIIILLNFFIWLIKPIFNPNFLSSNSGLIIACLYLYKMKSIAQSEKKELMFQLA